MGLFTTLGTGRDIRDTLREWRAFKQQTGRWPIFSVITYVSLWLGLLACGMLLLIYSQRHSWTKPRVVLVVLATLAPLAVVWEIVERAARLLDMRRCGGARRKASQD